MPGRCAARARRVRKSADSVVERGAGAQPTGTRCWDRTTGSPQAALPPRTRICGSRVALRQALRVASSFGGFRAGGALLGECGVVVVAALAIEDREPWRGGYVLAAIDAVLHVRHVRQHAGFDEGADVQPHAVIQTRLPAEGLLFDRLPPDEDVVGRLAVQDAGELPSQRARGLGAG